MEEKITNIFINSVEIDEAIEKATRLVGLLQEAQQIVRSLSMEDSHKD